MNKIICADALEALESMESQSINTVVTSPPYYGLRDYGVDGQIGLEQTPAEYIEKLVDVFREVRRVLKDDGTLWVNIGDSYAANRPYQVHNTKGAVNHTYSRGAKVPEGLKAKDLIGIPWMLAFALRADGWYLRQDIIWAKPNPMPESVKDRCTKSHEHIFLLSKSPKYYFDAEAISEPIAGASTKRYAQKIEQQKGSDRVPGKSNGPMKSVLPRFGGNKYANLQNYPGSDKYRTKSGSIYMPAPRRNKRDVWTVSTKPFKGAHFAVFPPDLIAPCVLAGCPKNGTVLDPFFGSGTTGEVAMSFGREFVGIELNEDYCRIAETRTGTSVTELEAAE